MPIKIYEDFMKPDPMMQHFVQQRMAEQERISNERRNFLSDPLNVERIVSHFHHQALPEDKAAKIATGSSLEKIEKGIPKGDPRKGMGARTVAEAQQAILASPGRHPVEVVAEAYNKNLGGLVDKGLYNYIREQNSSLIGGKVATAPGYEKWKQLPEQAENKWEYTNPLLSAGIGAAFSLAGAGIGSMLAPGPGTVAGGLAGRVAATAVGGWLGRTLAVKAGQTVLGQAGKAGLVAIPSFAIFDTAHNVLGETDWGKSRPISRLLVAGVGGGAADYAMMRGLSVATKPVVDAFKDFNMMGDVLAKEPSIGNILKYDKARAGVGEEARNVMKDRMSYKTGATEEASEYYKNNIPLGEGIARPRLDALEKETYLSSILKGETHEGALKTATEASRMAVAKSISEAAIKDEMNFKSLLAERSALHPEIDPIQHSINIRNEQEFINNVLGSGGGKVSTSEFPSIIKNKKKINQLKLDEATKATTEEYERQIGDIVPGVKSLDDLKMASELRNLSRRDSVIALGKIQQAKNTGLMTEEEARLWSAPIEKVIRRDHRDLLGLGVEENVFDLSGKAVDTAKGHELAMSSLTKALEHSDPAKAIDIWDNTISHVLSNSVSSKSKDEFLSKLSVFTSTDAHKNMMEKAKGLFTDNLSNMIYGVGAVASATGLISLMTPSSAEAFNVEPFVKAAKKLTGAEMELAVSKLMTSPVVSADGQTFLQGAASLSMKPKTEYIIRKEGIGPILSRIASPGLNEQFLFRAGTGPRAILASHTRAAAADTTDMLGVASRNLSVIPEETNIIREYMKPMLKYDPMLAEFNGITAQHDVLDQILSGKYKVAADIEQAGLSKRIKTGNLDEADMEAVRYFNNLKSGLEEDLKRFEEPVKAYKNEYKERAQYLVENHSSSRVFFGAEGEKMRGFAATDPWFGEFNEKVMNSLSHDEKLAAARLKELMQFQAKRAEEAGLKTISKEGYMPHAFHPDSDLANLDKIAKDVMFSKGAGIDMAKFHSRSFDSLPMMPDAHFAMAKYIPDSNLRIQMSSFWKEWGPFAKEAEYKGYTGVAEHLKTIQKAFSPVDGFGGWEKWASRIQAFEAARLISLSPAVGFKHSMKLMASLSFGGTSTIKSLPGAIKMSYDLQLNNLLRTAPQNIRAALAKSFIGGKDMFAMANDIVPVQKDLSWFDAGIKKWNDNTNFIVNNVEILDRGVSVLSSLNMAAKRGMTPEQAAYLVHDTIVRANFLSGIHNPSWLRDPKTRLLFLFQGTPFKIWEQRLYTAIRGGQAISDGTKKVYQQLISDIKTGERNMKYGLIKDAFTAARDVNGNSYSGEMMRMLLTLGAVAYGGKQVLDVSFMDQILHPPFIKVKEQSAGLATNPIMGAAYGTLMSKDDETSNFIQFMKKWLPQGPIPAAVVKAHRLSKNDIPEIYKDSKVQYFFGVPSWHRED